MTCCAYCGQPATLKIVANPEAVCLDHALEFWTGLLTFASDHRDTCVKGEHLCACRTCEESRVSAQRTAAIRAAGPPPRDQEHPQIRLAS